MIYDSWPWKHEIARRAHELGRRKNLKRWTELSSVNAEKDIFISAYAIRKLIESFKISDEVESISLNSETYKPVGRAIDVMNRDKIDELYDLSVSSSARISIKDFCNQIIHSYIFLLAFDDKTGKLAGFFVASDRDKVRRLLYFNIDEIIETLIKVSNDDIVYARMERESIGKPIKITKKSSILGLC